VPLISAADIDFALQDFSGAASQNVVYGVQSCWGDLKREPLLVPSESGLQNVGTHISLTIRDGALTGLQDESTITVDGVDHVIRDVGVALQDGTRQLTLLVK